MQRLALVAVLVLLALASAALGAQTYTVTITNYAFTPQNLTINVGDTVRWEVPDPNGQHIIQIVDWDQGWTCMLNRHTIMSIQLAFTASGTFHSHDPNHDYLSGSTETGIITVNANTPVQPTTWGSIKTLFQ